MSANRVHTFCWICEPGCGLVAEVRDGAVEQLRPDVEHPVHQGFCCHMGVHYLQVHSDPDRLDRSLRRTNPCGAERGEFEPVDRDEAVRETQQELGVHTVLGDPDLAPVAPIAATLWAAGTSLVELASQPCGTRVLPEAVPSHVFDIAVQHDDSLIDCCPALFLLARGMVKAIYADLAGEHPDQLKLVTRRTHHMVNSWLHNVPVFDHAVYGDNPLWMHPDDALRRGLVAGDAVIVRNRYGVVEATLQFDDSLRRGVVALTYGWGQSGAHGLRVARREGGVNANLLAPTGRDGFDPISNQSQLTGINVDVVRT